MTKKLMRYLKICFAAAILFLNPSCTQPAPRVVPPLPVKVADVQKKDVPIYIEVIGFLNPPNTVQVRPQVGGRLVAVHVVEGAMVKKGDILYTIDPMIYKANLESAKATLEKDKASLELAKNTVERFRELVKNDYVSKLTFDQYLTNVKTMEAQLLIDEAAVEIAEINLDYTTITAPLDGKISLFNVDVGNIVSANDLTALTVISQIDPIEARFALTQNEFQIIKQAQENQALTFEVILQEVSTNNQSIAKLDVPTRKGVVNFIDSKIDLSTGTILLKGDIDNQDQLFWPGEFVRVRLFVKTLKDALVVPYQAVQVGQNGNFLYVVGADNVAKFRSIKLGSRIGDEIVILEGVEDGEKVVIEGQINLRPDAKVFIPPPSGTKPAEVKEKPR